MSDVLIGHSYFQRFDPSVWQQRTPYAPLGTLYAASAVRSLAADVALFDAVLARSEREWDDALAAHRPRVAVLFEDNFNYLSKMCLLRMRQAAFAMIAMAKARDSFVLVCGADATDHPHLYLGRGADFVLLREGDETLLELLPLLLNGHGFDPSGILGLAWMDREVVMRTGPRPNLADLDALPFPAWDLIDVERYRHIWLRSHGFLSMNMVTTRGCPYHCNWCAKPIWGQRVHSRSPENTVDEMSGLQRAYAPDHIWFMDDIMGLKRGWFHRFADACEAARIRIPFKCLSRADLLLREGEIDALARAGCKEVWIGAESGSQRVLDAMEKGIRIDQIEAATGALRAAGVEVGFFLQFGYPGETKQDVRRTLELVRRTDPDHIGTSVSYPLPGTKFYDRVRSQLGPKQNWVDSADLDVMFTGTFRTPYYRCAKRALSAEHRARRVSKRIRHALHERRGFSRSLLADVAVFARCSARSLFARAGMEITSHLPHRAMRPIAPVLSPADAATPTPPGTLEERSLHATYSSEDGR
jgi:anaerobic magnesium-protoporphyrin IX monomethyl ester cyclase